MKKFEPNPEIDGTTAPPADGLLLWTLWRSGTHWLAQMLCDLTGMTASYASDDAGDYMTETRDQIEHLTPGHILIRHICLEPAELLNIAERRGMRVVFLYRDPRDVIVSNIHMRKFREGHRKGMPPFPDMPIGQILSWELEHLRDAYARLLPDWAEATHPRLAKVRYEALHADAFAALQALAGFLGPAPTDERLRKVVALNAFREQTGRRPGRADAGAHARKGVVGEHRTFFSESDQRRLNALLHDALRRMNYPI